MFLLCREQYLEGTQVGTGTGADLMYTDGADRCLSPCTFVVAAAQPITWLNYTGAFGVPGVPYWGHLIVSLIGVS